MDIQVVNSSGDFWKGTLPLLNSPPFKVSEKSVVILTDKKTEGRDVISTCKKKQKTTTTHVQLQEMSGDIIQYILLYFFLKRKQITAKTNKCGFNDFFFGRNKRWNHQ